jgi:hypothetical protein
MIMRLEDGILCQSVSFIEILMAELRITGGLVQEEE